MKKVLAISVFTLAMLSMLLLLWFSDSGTIEVPGRVESFKHTEFGYEYKIDFGSRGKVEVSSEEKLRGLVVGVFNSNVWDDATDDTFREIKK